MSVAAQRLRDMAADPREFRRQLLIDTDSGPSQLSTVVDQWQAADFSALDGGWRGVVGLPRDSAATFFQRAFLERGRGHSKTSDLAVMCTWVMFASRRQLAGVAAAADKDQARLLRNAIERLARLNPWLSQRVQDPTANRKRPLVDAQNYRIRNTASGSTLDILSCDAGSSYGINPDFIVVDELTHWPKRDLFDSLLSAVAKRSHAMLVIISNAGNSQGTSWQWHVRESIRTDPSWYFSRLDGPQAKWITAHRLAEQRRLLPPKAYRRLWLNEWTTDEGDAVDEADLSAALTLVGPTEFTPKLGPFLGSLDLGVRADHSALVIFATNPLGEKVRVASVESWDPKSFGGRVPLQLVEQACLQAARDYRLAGIAFDPTQGELLAERLSEQGVTMYRYPWSVASKQRMALALVQAFRDREVELYDHPALLRDLRRMSIVERAGRWTFVTPRDEHGHCDVGAAFVQGLVWALGTRRDCLGLPDQELSTA